MKKTLSLFALIMVFTIFAAFPTIFSVPASAADGGQAGLVITSHSDGDIIDRTADSITISWTSINNADHYRLTIKNMADGSKPLDKDYTKTSITIDPSRYFTNDGEFKIYVGAYAEGQTGVNTLNGGSAWHAIYLRTETPEPKLIYASPALTSPAVDIKYDSKAYCYYGVYDGVIDPTKDLTIKWENIYADYYSVTAAILKGEPDLGSTSEKKLHTIVLQKKRTTCKYTIDKEDLEAYAGKYLKIVIQPMADDGDYGLMAMSYLKLADNLPELDAPPINEDTNESKDVPPATDDTNQETESITFFLQNQSPWHNYPYGHKDEKCAKNTDLAYSGCGVLSLTNAVYQLNGNFIDPTLIADYAMNNGHRQCGVGTVRTLYSSFADEYGAQYGFKYGTLYTEVNFSTMRKELENGAVIIANTPGHFFVISRYDKTTDTYLVLDSLPSKNRGTTENGDWKTASELSGGSLKVRYFVTLLQSADISNAHSPVVYPSINSGRLETSIPTTTAKPGDTLELPIYIDSPERGVPNDLEANDYAEETLEVHISPSISTDAIEEPNTPKITDTKSGIEAANTTNNSVEFQHVQLLLTGGLTLSIAFICGITIVICLKERKG